MDISSRHRFFLPLVVSAVLILTMAIFYGTMLPVGSIHHTDEYRTLDRAHGFAVHHDYLTVYSGNRPTFAKPPLQYWMTAALLARGSDMELALRLPSFLFGLGILLVTGWLAWLILPQRPWAIPVAIFLIASSTRFWESAMSALLDTGATLFAMIAFAGTLAALRQPKWWYVVALACGIGAFQKAPIPIAFALGVVVVAAATRRLHGIDVGASLKSRHFAYSAGITVALVLLWPAIEWLRYGPASFRSAYVHQMVERFSPLGESSGPHRGFDVLILDGEPIQRAIAIAAMLWLPWRLRRFDLLALPAIFLAYCVAVAFASGTVSPRYSLIFLPMMLASLAAIIVVAVPNRWAKYATIAVLSLISLGPYKLPSALGLTGDNSQAKYIPLLKEVGAALRLTETLLVCNKDGRGIYSGAISYYASDGRPFFRISSVADLTAKQARGVIKPPYRGLCGSRRIEVLKPALENYAEISTAAGLVHWTASGLREPSPGSPAPAAPGQ